MLRMPRGLRRSFLPLGAALATATLVGGSCDSTTGPVPDLDGLWLMIAFESDGVVASSVTGQFNFLANGTYTASGTITYPGQPPEDITSAGTWTQDGTTLTLDDGTDVGEWELAFSASGASVVLALQNDASASRLTLQRP